jgi:hypothetical protein
MIGIGFGGVSVNSCTRQRPRESNAQVIARWIEELGFIFPLGTNHYIDLLDQVPKVRKYKERP